MKIAVALSGGVDSAVAAALLKQQGHDLVGVTALVWPDSRCCDARALNDAKLVANALKLPYFTVDVMSEFRSEVVDPFVHDYRQGRTPNPCPLCNTKIRFGTMWERIRENVPDCSAVATGHYAVISLGVKDSDPKTPSPQASTTKKYTLRKGVDPDKDQSYMLYGLSQEQLSRTLTPLGGYTKEQVRKLAEEFGLFVSKKPDSQDACFVNGDYKRFLKEYETNSRGRFLNLPGGAAVEGHLVDRKGNILRTHDGIENYTIGQRKGLHLQRPGTENKPLYVVAIDAERQQVIVGDESELFSPAFKMSDVNWILGEPNQPIHISVRIRYNSEEVLATVTALPNRCAKVVFDQPQKSVTPGQAAVMYEGDVVLGGGIINS
jgi:tRNA-specific 2-thiouridylase